ncbi:MAG: hypothetical protein ABI165_17475, partial [Bryobacteraceae bacterium]
MHLPSTSWLRWPLFAALVLSGAALATRAAIGPFHFVLFVNRPLVAEGAFALAATLLLLSRHNAAAPSSNAPPASLAAALLLTAAFLFPSL